MSDLLAELKRKQKPVAAPNAERETRNAEPNESLTTVGGEGEGAKPKHVFHVQEVNGIRDFKLNIDGPGVWECTGRNGAGKSSLISAVLGACGDKTATLEPTDGVAKGKIEMGGGVTLRIGSRKVADGQPEVRLVGAGPLARLIDPQLVDKERAAATRIKAMVELMPVPVDDEVRAELTQNDSTLAEYIRHDPAEDALMLAEAVRNQANKLALEKEKAAEAAGGEMGAYEKQIEALAAAEPLDFEAGDYEAASAAAVEASRRSAILHEKAGQRARFEAQKAEIEKNFGDRPDARPVELKIEKLSEEIAALNSRLAELRSEWQEARSERARLDEAARRWDMQAEILKRPVEGPTMEEAQAAAEEAKGLEEKARRAARLQSVKKLGEAHEEAKQVKFNAEERGKALRGIAKGTTDALARLLERRGLDGVAIQEGRLKAWMVPKGGTEPEWMDFEERLSFGERVAVALKIALRGIDVTSVEHRTTGARLPLLALDPNFWNALDGGNKARVAEEARRQGVCLITEAPGDGELRVRSV